ncbi:hypothetical protein B0H17DRAFT_1143134 [Mycena rosella]|uniref:Uncharacterized protein n=1 Tax=Mycena rosella TaxID=1033263 RepID=A0AAD7CVP2_MYCRO|nr:hypothetical protein B0H17DRAFT_1143134 [Mycena rosella]
MYTTGASKSLVPARPANTRGLISGGSTNEPDLPCIDWRSLPPSKPPIWTQGCGGKLTTGRSRVTLESRNWDPKIAISTDKHGFENELEQNLQKFPKEVTQRVITLQSEVFYIYFRRGLRHGGDQILLPRENGPRTWVSNYRGKLLPQEKVK